MHKLRFISTHDPDKSGEVDKPVDLRVNSAKQRDGHNLASSEESDNNILASLLKHSKNEPGPFSNDAVLSQRHLSSRYNESFHPYLYIKSEIDSRQNGNNLDWAGEATSRYKGSSSYSNNYTKDLDALNESDRKEFVPNYRKFYYKCYNQSISSEVKNEKNRHKSEERVDSNYPTHKHSEVEVVDLEDSERFESQWSYHSTTSDLAKNKNYAHASSYDSTILRKRLLANGYDTNLSGRKQIADDLEYDGNRKREGHDTDTGNYFHMRKRLLSYEKSVNSENRISDSEKSTVNLRDAPTMVQSAQWGYRVCTPKGQLYKLVQQENAIGNVQKKLSVTLQNSIVEKDENKTIKYLLAISGNEKQLTPNEIQRLPSSNFHPQMYHMGHRYDNVYDGKKEYVHTTQIYCPQVVRPTNGVLRNLLMVDSSKSSVAPGTGPPSSGSPGSDSTSSGSTDSGVYCDNDEKRRSSRVLSGRHIKTGTGASITTLRLLRKMILERKSKNDRKI